MNKTEAFIQDIENGNDKYTEKRLYEIIDLEPQNLQHFVITFIETFEESSTLLDTAFSFLDEQSFAEVIKLCVKLLKTNKRDSAESAIAYASLQFPHLLHEYAEDLFILKPNEDTYYWNWFFREIENFDFLKSKLNKSNSFWTKLTQKPDYDLYFDIFTSLLEIRSNDAIKLAVKFAKEVSLFNNLGEAYKQQTFNKIIRHLLNCVGFDYDGENISKLQERVKMWHFAFKSEYFDSIRKDFKHPTWLNFDSAYNFEFDFGGVIKRDDESTLFHVMTIDPVPNDFGISLKKLVLGFEFEYYEKVFYKHDENGFPHYIKTYEVGKKMEVDEILQTKIRLSETPKRWNYQDWALSNDRENLNRFGGEPSWIQGADYPICPETGEIMKFLFQFDNLPTSQHFPFGGEGIFYFFWCDTSKISTYVYQQT
jgi:hypothetical protein